MLLKLLIKLVEHIVVINFDLMNLIIFIILYCIIIVHKHLNYYIKTCLML